MSTERIGGNFALLKPERPEDRPRLWNRDGYRAPWSDWTAAAKRPANQRSRELTDEDVEMLRHVRDGLRRELHDYVRRRVSRSLDNAEGNLSIEEMFAVAARATDLWHQETGISLDDLARLAALIEGDER